MLMGGLSVFDIEKAEPERLRRDIATGVGPVLTTVTLLWAVFPIATSPKLTTPGEIETWSASEFDPTIPDPQPISAVVRNATAIAMYRTRVRCSLGEYPQDLLQARDKD